jgi:D-3-phosphoglycerate dehydrogenase / 2-oxoglutarate reductase
VPCERGMSPFAIAPLRELYGQTFGLVGLGRTGQATARLAGGLGMTVLAFSPTCDQTTFDEVVARRASTLEEVLETSDVVSLHLALTPATRGLIGRPELARMKSTAYLINTSRGATIDETALADALAARRIAGAGLDVFMNDALPEDHRLLGLDNVVLTPHIAGSTTAAMERAARTLARGIIAVVRDEKPDNLVNSEVWPRRWWAREQIA